MAADAKPPPPCYPPYPISSGAGRASSSIPAMLAPLAPLRVVCVFGSDDGAANFAKPTGWRVSHLKGDHCLVGPGAPCVRALARLDWPQQDAGKLNGSAECDSKDVDFSVDALVVTVSELQALRWRDLQHFVQLDAAAFVYGSSDDWCSWMAIVRATSAQLPLLLLPGPRVTAQQLLLVRELPRPTFRTRPWIHIAAGGAKAAKLPSDVEASSDTPRAFVGDAGACTLRPVAEACPEPQDAGTPGSPLCLPSLVRVHLEQSALGVTASRVFPSPEPAHEGDFEYRVAEPYIAPTAHQMVSEALQSRSISSSSHWPIRLQRSLAQYFDVLFVQACANGHDALVLALKSVGICPGDDVLLPAWTFIAVLNAVVALGANPVMADVSPGQYNPSREQWIAAATERTRALILCYTFGLVCDAQDVADLCKEKCWYFIEDISEAIGCRWRGKLLGSFGDAAACSLFANKLITAGDGGFVLTNCADLGPRIAAFATHGGNFGDGLWRFVHPELGFNTKISGLSAALAVAAVAEIDRLAEHRRQVASWYTRELACLTDITVMPWRPEATAAYDVPWLFGVHVESSAVRDELRRFLALKRIETRNYFLPIHLQPSYDALRAETGALPLRFEESEWLGAVGLNLPTHAYMTEEDVRFIVAVVAEFFGRQLPRPSRPPLVLPQFQSYDETTVMTCKRTCATQTLDDCL